MIQQLLCAIGWHDWSKWSDPKPGWKRQVTNHWRGPNLSCMIVIRSCNNCNIPQREIVE